MEPEAFEQIEQAARSGGLEGALDLLMERFREEKNYPQLFEARLMQKRLELGLPLIQSAPLDELPETVERVYEEAFIQAAREVGGLFLADGEISRAWPYFRAIGENRPVADAIEKVEPREGIDGVIQIALQEQVHPRKGFELLLANHGICRAITFFEQYTDRKTRPDCLSLIVRTLHGELVESLQRAIAQAEGSAPVASSIPALIAGREWLFEGNSYHVDTSHLTAVMRFSLEAKDRATLALAREMAEYGTHLAPMFHYRMDPPFDNVYLDHKVYLDALLGENVDASVAHFRAKLPPGDPPEADSGPAQVLVGLLARLGRYREAIEVSRAWLAHLEPSQLICPSVLELCDRAGERALLGQFAREKEDLLSYVAALASPPG